MTRQARWLLVGTLVVLAIGLAPIVLGHGNVLSVDSQHSPDGTVRVESSLAFEDAWIVVFADAGGSPGQPIGHTAIAAGTEVTPTTVSIADSVWRNWSGARTVHVRLRHEDGDGEFNPADDPLITQLDKPVGDTVTLQRSERRAVVLAEAAHPPTITGNATVRRVAMPVDGRIVLHEAGPDSPVVGSQPLSAGLHEDVTVALSPEFYRYQSDSFSVTAVLYGGSEGDPIAAETRIMAGDRPVATTFQLTPENATTPVPPSTSATPTPNEPDGSTTVGHGGHTHHDDGDHTLEESPESSDGVHEGNHAETEPATATPTIGTDALADEDGPVGAGSEEGDGRSGAGLGGESVTMTDGAGSGFTVLAALVGLLVTPLMVRKV